jgi:3-oxoacyl-[acyl-carrier-protein] synthase III
MLDSVFAPHTDKFFIDIERVGNCGSASVLIALDEYLRHNAPESGTVGIIAAAEASKWMYGGFAIHW